MSSNNRMPDELVLGPNEYEEIDAIGRWKLEHKLIEEHCSPLEPEFRKKSRDSSDRFDGIEYKVMLDPAAKPEQSSVKLRMIIPDNYPSELPRVYPVDYQIHFDHSNHTYRDKDGKVHMCMLFEEDWTEDCTLAGLMVLSSIWMHKWMVWKREGKWPGKGRKHCIRCGNVGKNCSC